MHPAMSFHQVPLDLGDFPTRHNYLLALRQHHIERASWPAGSTSWGADLLRAGSDGLRAG